MTGVWVDVAFWVFGLAAVWFGWRVFITDSMVRATFSLLVSFCNVGALLVLLLAEYLGVAMFFMMGVEMTIMAIYMVAFMMNPAGLNPMQMVHQPKIAAGVGVLCAVGFASVALAADLDAVALVDPSGTIRAVGLELMGSSMLLMQVVGVTLVATMVGAVVLSTSSGRFGPADEGSVPPAMVPGDDSTRPGVGVGGSDDGRQAGHDHGSRHTGHGGHG